MRIISEHFTGMQLLITMNRILESRINVIELVDKMVR